MLTGPNFEPIPNPDPNPNPDSDPLSGQTHEWPKADFTPRMDTRLALDPTLKAAVKIQWPLVWVILMRCLPALIQIIFAIMARQAKADMAAGKLGVGAALDTLRIPHDGQDEPESVRLAVAELEMKAVKERAKVMSKQERSLTEPWF